MKCNICDNPTVHKEQEVIYTNGQIDLEVEDRCVMCGNLVYGNVKTVGQLERKRL